MIAAGAKIPALAERAATCFLSMRALAIGAAGVLSLIAAVPAWWKLGSLSHLTPLAYRAIAHTTAIN
jgi:hypothetical protein